MKNNEAKSRCNYKKMISVLFAVSGLCFGHFAADLDGDRYVGPDDLAVLASFWIDSDNPDCTGDTGSDCLVDMEDFAQLTQQWQWMECVWSASASSLENDSLAASNAIDGNMGTRWSSAFFDNQWLLIDLGQARNIYGSKIYWEAAYAKDYDIEISDDGLNWTTAFSVRNGDGGTDDISFPEQSMEYIRIKCIKRATPYGSSIYEVELKSDDVCRTPPVSWNLVWSDEFDGPNLNSQNWTHETGTGSQGWGNWEWQYYTSRPENCRIENGILIVEARRENYGGMSYTSARIKSQNKRSFQYGRIEARIKMPAGGHGIWPAFWMLGSNITTFGWPTCGELDIVEMMSNPGEALGTIHYGNLSGDHVSQGGKDTSAGILSDDFHVYAVQWDETGIRWYCDDNKYFTASSWTSNAGAFPAPFNQPAFIILNFAVGAWWWDPAVTATIPFPRQLQVDYVRVYQQTF